MMCLFCFFLGGEEDLGVAVVEERGRREDGEKRRGEGGVRGGGEGGSGGAIKEGREEKRGKGVRASSRELMCGKEKREKWE